MTMSKPFALPLLMAVLVLLAVSGAARRLEADGSTGGGEAAAVFGAGLPVIQFLKGLYQQQLSGPSSSCKTYDPNNPACHGH
ncbi:hypothetical protein GQ55_1G378800 [Panicum hallii var. hallii]|uniref:Uncharacterized protein n=1 Tax=Panicum hallii var. hallii TaxID=1504633 RepID=A0A2T7FBQ8_9POAL|nr:hypothetical protein GQ55_1G378800 [Panicum hallii var. hallii]